MAPLEAGPESARREQVESRAGTLSPRERQAERPSPRLIVRLAGVPLLLIGSLIVFGRVAQADFWSLKLAGAGSVLASVILFRAGRLAGVVGALVAAYLLAVAITVLASGPRADEGETTLGQLPAQLALLGLGVALLVGAIQVFRDWSRLRWV